MHYKIAGIDSIIIYFGDTINEDISNEILSSFKTIQEKNLDGIIEIVPSYTTIYIQFDLFVYNHDKLFDTIKTLLDTSKKTLNQKQKDIVIIPVYYGQEVGLDLKRVAELNNLSIKEVIKIHSAKIYKVYTIGFAPAFGYMGEVDQRIKTPRLQSPRQKIPKKSVALADIQTAIYPLSSPGGWNILGATYLDMYDKSLAGFSYLSIGNRVKFEPISKQEYLNNGGEL